MRTAHEEVLFVVGYSLDVHLLSPFPVSFVLGTREVDYDRRLLVSGSENARIFADVYVLRQLPKDCATSLVNENELVAQVGTPVRFEWRRDVRGRACLGDSYVPRSLKSNILAISKIRIELKLRTSNMICLPIS